MNNIKISIFESIYLIYMFLLFETTIDFNIFNSPKGYWLEHLTGNAKGKRICPFGKVIIFFFIGILLCRHFVKLPKYTMISSICIGFILSLMNMNALVYISPVLIYELYPIIIK
ncbi:hypothetical protein CPAV1605_555 [seawater metagenome]|uniref:DUF5658 domain-containing protein n=1 Tax=seawater metagenome TaxID=1561972 RepID=A0A5E8CM47_9ZZZZ